jgi:catechol 2,3-dioxygenase-like lactoylglutathione lyase family enzyme
VITKLSHAGVLVLNQDSAKSFYTEKLGFTVGADVQMGAEFAEAGEGFRWLTVSPPGQPDLQFILAAPEMGHDEQTARQLRELIAKGVFGGGVWETDDCRKTHQELAGRGVTFLQEPAERPYGVEAVFRDDSGNWFSLTESFFSKMQHS